MNKQSGSGGGFFWLIIILALVWGFNKYQSVQRERAEKEQRERMNSIITSAVISGGAAILEGICSPQPVPASLPDHRVPTPNPPSFGTTTYGPNGEVYKTYPNTSYGTSTPP